MKFFILLEYAVNLILLSYFHIHIFQLNSYSYKFHTHWLNTNKRRIFLQLFLVLLPLLLLLFNHIATQIVASLILAISIWYNFPKKKAKIGFHFTKRVMRMFITQVILFAIFLLVGGTKNLVITLAIFNSIMFFIYLVINFINSPIEKLIKKNYIRQAKKILQGMPNLLIIGVTGSYGKTSVKNFLEKTLSSKYEVLATPKNYNTPMGVVKTIREYLKPTHQIFICEMGAYTCGEIKEICDIVKPKMGVITSIGPQHLETFKSMENIVKTKFELADAVSENNGTIFLNYDNEYISSKKDLNCKTISYGIENETLDYNAYNLVSSSKGLSFEMADKEGTVYTFHTKLIGKHNIVNIAGAIAVANFLGVPFKNLIPRVKEIKGVEHRLQLLTPSPHFAIIDDSYNSNPVSSKSALDTLAEFEGTKIIVTPGLVQLGDQEKQYNFELGVYMADICDYIFLVGEHANSILEGVRSKKFDENRLFRVSSPNEAMQKIRSFGINGNVTVLLENDLPDNYR